MAQPMGDHQPDPRVARRWLWIVWGSLGLGLAGQMVDLAWHAKFGRFVTAADVFQAHWLTWLALAITIAACMVGMRSGQIASRGFGYVLIASALHVVGHTWNAWEHIHGAQEPIVPHVMLAVSGVALIVTAGFTTHLLFGRDVRPLAKAKEHAG